MRSSIDSASSERIVNDFVDERSPFQEWSYKSNISDFAALINLTKAAIAVGYMKMPHHLNSNGLLWAAFVIIISITLSFLGSHVLIRTQEKVAKDYGEEYICYPDVIKLMMDRSTRPCCRRFSLYIRNGIIVFIILFHIIICTIYVNYMSYKSLFFFGSKEAVREIVEVCLIPPLVIVCLLIWKLEHVTYISALGDALIACSLVIIFYLIFTDEDESKMLCLSDVSDANLLGLSDIMGTSFFGAHTYGVMLIVYGHMKNPEDFLKPLGVLSQTYFIVLVFMILAVIQGCFRLASLGDFPDLSDGPERTWRLVLRVMNSVVIFLSIPIHFQVCIEMTGHYFYYRLPESYPLFLINCIVRFTYILVTVILALFVPTIVWFYPMFGNTLIAFGAILLPALVEFLYVKNEEKNWKYYKTVITDMVLMISGVFYFTLEVILEIFPSSSTKKLNDEDYLLI